MPLHRRLPKRGFKNPFRTNYSIVNIGDIEKAATEKKIDIKKEITKEDFFKAGLIRKKSDLVKVLANGKLTQTIMLKVEKASKKAIKMVSEKKGNITFYKKVDKNTEKIKKVKEKNME